MVKLKTKICIFSGSFYGGGAEKVSINLANYFKKKNYLVTLLLINGKGPYKNLLNKNINLKVLKKKTKLGTFFNLINFLKSNNFDYLLSTMRATNIVSGIAKYFYPVKYKIIFREPNTLDEILSYNFFVRNFYLILMKIAYRNAKGLIANSRDTLNDLLKYNIIPYNKKKIIIGNPLIKNKKFYYKSKNNLISISVGRLEKQKNFTFLIKTFKKVIEKKPNAKLYIFGEGSEYNYLSKLIIELKLDKNVFLKPFTTNIKKYFLEADLYIMTSKWEGFGNVLVEAMSYGKKIICTTSKGGPNEILKDCKNSHIKTISSKSLSKNIIKELSKKNLKSNSHNMIKNSFNYMIDEISDKYLTFMNKV